MTRLVIIFIAFVNYTRAETDVSGNTEHQNRNELNDSATTTTVRPIRNQFLQNFYQIVRNSYGTGTVDESVHQLPTEALNGIYVECILGLSFSCLQKKMIDFLYRLDKLKSIDLIGKSIVVVRKPEHSSETAVMAKIAKYVDRAYLKDIIDYLIDKFFDNHVLRVKIPSYFDDNTDEMNESTFLDIDFGVQRNPLTARDGKSGKPGHHGKNRGLKKLLMMMGLLMCMKLAMMGPLMLGLIGLKAMKALILAVMSITISKMMMLGKSHMNGMLSGGHEAATSSGWDRTIQEQLTSTSSLPYHMEPPVPYNGYTVH